MMQRLIIYRVYKMFDWLYAAVSAAARRYACLFIFLSHISTRPRVINTDCQRKNRYVQIFCHTHINRATSLTFSGPVHHPMEQLVYKFHFHISNGIAFISPFVTYPNLCIPTMKEKVHFNSINLNTKKWLWNW